MPRFIPSRISHLIMELSQLYQPADRVAFWELDRVLEALFHHYARSLARTTEDLYAPFDPDADTLPPASAAGSDPLGRVADRMEGLLTRANFTQADADALLNATDREVLTRLEIDSDLEGLEHLSVFHRGLGTKAVQIRSARKLFRLVEREVPTYRRVVIVVRTREDPHLMLKLFKDVPTDDLELLLPTVRVKMKLLDKLKLSGSGGAAAISAWKLLRLAYTYTPTIAKLLAVPFKILLLPLIVLVGAIYGGKTVLDYGKIKSSYVTALAEHLYAITMASNRSVISRLSAMAGEEDSKEVLLAYALLAGKERPGLTSDQLRARAEAFVWDRYRARITFDVADAVAKLKDLDLVWEEDGLLNAVPIDAALRRADQAWDELFSAPTRAQSRRLRLLRVARAEAAAHSARARADAPEPPDEAPTANRPHSEPPAADDPENPSTEPRQPEAKA